MKSEDAIAAAAAEGLTLAMREGSASKFWGVSKAGRTERFKAQVHGRYLGTFESAEEASLVIARAYPDGPPATAPRAASAALSLEEVTRLAAAEELTLLRDDAGASGFRGVSKLIDKPRERSYRADLPGGRYTNRYAGVYATAHEAALAIARRLGPAESAKRQAESRNSGGWLRTQATELTTEQALACALDEGLTLRRAKANVGGTMKFWGVYPAGGTQSERWRASIYVGLNYAGEGPNPSNQDETTQRALGQHLTAGSNGTIHVGQFASPEGAALAIARRLRDAPQLASHVQGLQLRHAGESTQPRKRHRNDGGSSASHTQGSGSSGDTESQGDLMVVEAVEVWSDGGEEAEGILECAVVAYH